MRTKKRCEYCKVMRNHITYIKGKYYCGSCKRHARGIHFIHINKTIPEILETVYKPSLNGKHSVVKLSPLLAGRRIKIVLVDE